MSETWLTNGESSDGHRWLSLDEERIEVAGIDYVTIGVCDLERSVRFYRRLFGCHVVEHARSDAASVLMSTGGSTYLALHRRGGALGEHARPRGRWSFVVADLDRARESIWNLGVATADGTDVPRRIHPWRQARSFVIRDPDGNEIELVERSHGFQEHRATVATRVRT